MSSDFAPAPSFPSPPPPSPSAEAHWVIPYASSLSEPCAAALGQLDGTGAAGEARLPNLRALLGLLQATERQEGDEFALSMPHERLLARAWGWPAEDGRIPWAAWWAAHDGVALAADRPWALLSPGHWLMGRDHLTVIDPAGLGLRDVDSRALLEAVRPLFEDDGWQVIWGSAHRWYASHPALARLPTASLDRVVGRNPDVWLTDHPEARGVRRLQSEVQMLLYQHPINDARTASGELTVNSFWLSGASAGAPMPPGKSPLCVDTLRAPLMADDMAGWLAAWDALDRTLLADLLARARQGEPVQLTLCGERHAVSYRNAPPAGWRAQLARGWQRLTGAGPGAPLRDTLAGL
ncbi:hypothetical protein GTZ97_12130 [Aquabacterium fontiphilum]|uniref:hypothetical protein n=1 Tax=Aquabacterium fontiphilum TaxID=450365 RepID=UPI001377E906|nr:hypothetical protein [Aquabacterium fontiphilum]NBD21412.1 hypothetical protein [Aquabacterium fontiphilum]